MKALFKRIWEFLKKLFHRSKKVVQEELEETKEQLLARLGEELKEIGEKMETAVDEELDRLEARALVIRSKLLNMTQETINEALATLNDGSDDLKD